MIFELAECQFKTDEGLLVCNSCRRKEEGRYSRCWGERLSSHSLALFDICDMAFVIVSAHRDDIDFVNSSYGEIYTFDYDIFEKMLEDNTNISLIEKFWESVEEITIDDFLDIDYKDKIFLFPKRYFKRY